MSDVLTNLKTHMRHLSSLNTELSFSQQALLSSAMKDLEELARRLTIPNLDMWVNLGSKNFIHKDGEVNLHSELWDLLKNFAPYIDFMGIHDLVSGSGSDDVRVHHYVINEVRVLEDPQKYSRIPDYLLEEFDLLLYVSKYGYTYPSISMYDSRQLVAWSKENLVLSAHLNLQKEQSILEHFIYAMINSKKR